MSKRLLGVAVLAMAAVVCGCPRTVMVPDVIGLMQAAAEAAIAAEGLTVGTVDTAYSAEAEEGVVTQQTPGGGADVAPGTAVNLVVSLGPDPAWCQPSLTLSHTTHYFDPYDVGLTVEVWNGGCQEATLNFTAESLAAWASVDPEAASSTGEDDRVVVTITVDHTGLAAGTYQGVVVIRDEAGNEQRVQLTMDVL